MEELSIKGAETSRWDCVSLGEVMLRLDPGEGRIHTARQFQAWEGGGEYNVARGLRRCFGMRTAVATAFADNPIGRLVEVDWSFPSKCTRLSIATVLKPPRDGLDSL